MKSAMMAHTCNSSTGRLLRKEDQFKCEDKLGYLVKPCFKQVNARTPDWTVVNVCCLSVWSLLLRSLG